MHISITGLIFLSCTGSYDHNIYVFDVLTGKEWWKVQTKDVVKCMPATDPASGVIVCGSHDGCIYALNIKVCNKHL